MDKILHKLLGSSIPLFFSFKRLMDNVWAPLEIGCWISETETFKTEYSLTLNWLPSQKLRVCTWQNIVSFRKESRIPTIKFSGGVSFRKVAQQAGFPNISMVCLSINSTCYCSFTSLHTSNGTTPIFGDGYQPNREANGSQLYEIKPYWTNVDVATHL